MSPNIAGTSTMYVSSSDRLSTSTRYTGPSAKIVNTTTIASASWYSPRRSGGLLRRMSMPSRSSRRMFCDGPLRHLLGRRLTLTFHTDSAASPNNPVAM